MTEGYNYQTYVQFPTLENIPDPQITSFNLAVLNKLLKQACTLIKTANKQKHNDKLGALSSLPLSLFHTEKEKVWENKIKQPKLALICSMTTQLDFCASSKNQPHHQTNDEM